MIVPCNSNGEPADSRDFQVARSAGGKTWGEMRLRKLIDQPRETHYLDEHTDLWIPRGVLLFRPWHKKRPVRDMMQLDG